MKIAALMLACLVLNGAQSLAQPREAHARKSAQAVRTATADTPALPGAVASDGAAKRDHRFSRKVTCQARRKTVSSVLEDLSAQTKVKLYAGCNNGDWQVRDRRMNVFCKDVALGDLMTSIARVMKFKWLRSQKDGVYSYRLFMDRKTLVEAERKRVVEEDKLRQWQARERTSLLSDLEKAAGISRSELEELKNDDPILYLYTEMGWSKMIPSLLREVPAAKDAWMSGEELTLAAANLPPAARKSVSQGLLDIGKDLTRTVGPGSAPSGMCRQPGQRKRCYQLCASAFLWSGLAVFCGRYGLLGRRLPANLIFRPLYRRI